MGRRDVAYAVQPKGVVKRQKMTPGELDSLGASAILGASTTEKSNGCHKRYQR